MCTLKVDPEIVCVEDPELSHWKTFKNGEERTPQTAFT